MSIDAAQPDEFPRGIDWREPVGVAAGAAIGATGRWATGEWLDIAAATTGAFPWHTLLVNLLGCLLIGIASVRVNGRIARGFLVSGVLGGFTTMSAFGLEVLDLTEAGRGDLAATYAAVSVVAGVAAVWTGSFRGAHSAGSTP